MKTNVVAVRVDASHEIGIGHFMRTLELARYLQAMGAEVHFICLELLPALQDLTVDHGHQLHQFALNKSENDFRQSLQVDQCWQPDAVHTSAMLDQIGEIDLLIVDSYKLGACWEREMKGKVALLLVIDDLADREHVADYLVDHNYGRIVSDYERLVPDHCTVLAGPQYAMLREEFSALRPQTLQQRKEIPNKKHLLITLGGGAVGKQNKRILDLIRRSDINNLERITLSNPAAEQHHLIPFAADFPVELVVIDYIEDMASAMSQADLCIGAGGISSMERAVLGLPSLVLLMADNQYESSQKLAQNECLFGCVRASEVDVDLLNKFFSVSNEDYALISNNAAEVSDGRGIQRIIAELGCA